MDANDPLQFHRSQIFEEFPQRGRFGEILQTQQMLEAIVVMQYFGVGNALHSRYHSVDKSQGQFGWMIKTASAFPGNIPLENASQVQFSAKPLKNEHSAEESKSGILEGKLDIFDELSHLPEMHPVGARLSDRFYSPNYTIFSSVIAGLLLQKRRNSPFFQDEELLKE